MGTILIQSTPSHPVSQSYLFNIILKFTLQVFCVVSFLWGFLPKASILFLLDPRVYISFDVRILSTCHVCKPIITYTDRSLGSQSHYLQTAQNEIFCLSHFLPAYVSASDLCYTKSALRLTRWIPSKVSAYITVTIFTCVHLISPNIIV
jgi:hypothetical protein